MGISPVLQLDKKLEELLLRLSQIDLENEQKSFNLAYENAEIDQQKKNSFTGITARYNKIKRFKS